MITILKYNWKRLTVLSLWFALLLLVVVGCVNPEVQSSVRALKTDFNIYSKNVTTDLDGATNEKEKEALIRETEKLKKNIKEHLDVLERITK